MLQNDLTCSILLTNACHLSCEHCFLKETRSRIVEMPLETIRRLTDSVARMGEQVIFLWGGGEPFLRGKSFFAELFDLPVFHADHVKHSLYSTLPAIYDPDWMTVANRFDEITYSVDRYRTLANPAVKEALNYLAGYQGYLKMSYTPSLDDRDDDIRRYYQIAADVGADSFHMGMLYDHTLLPVELYIRAYDILRECAVAGGPDLGFLPKNIDPLLPPDGYVGWRAFDCFQRGMYVFGERVTSCYICRSYGIECPSMLLEDLIAGKTLADMNTDYVGKFFHSPKGQCEDCGYYGLCKGGCPFFTAKNGGTIDAYCEFYKRIFADLYG